MVKGGDSMRKLLGCVLGLMLVFCLSAPVAANTLVPSLGGTGLYWDGAATNPDQLSNSGDTAQRSWLEDGLLKGPAGDITAEFDWDSGPKSLISFDPGVVDWEYAIVKTGLGQTPDKEGWYAYLNDFGFDLLNVPPEPTGLTQFPNGVSHLTVYGGQSVPEPTTMLLFGSGILFVGAFGRKRFKK